MNSVLGVHWEHFGMSDLGHNLIRELFTDERREEC